MRPWLIIAVLVILRATGPMAQEAVAEFKSDTGVPTTQLLVRSTTDIEILAPLLQAFVTANPPIHLRYEQWGSNALYDDSLAACERGSEPADVVFSSGVHQMVDLVNRACAHPYRSAATDALPVSRRWRDEIWGITQEPAVIIYNTAQVPKGTVPDTRFALLDLMRQPESAFTGKIATYDVEASGLGFLFAFMDSLEATTFGSLLEGFSRLQAVATCCSAEIIDGVAEGRYLIAYNVLGSYVDARPRRDVGVILPRDYTLFLSRTFMIPKQATHKREAALLLEFLLSPQGQTMLAEVNLFQRIDRDARPLPDSARRAIPIDPKLLVAMDRHRRQLFVGQWRTTFARERED